MAKAAIKRNQEVSTQIPFRRKEEAPEKVSFLESMLEDYFLKPDMFTTLTYINVLLGYCVLMLLLAGYNISYWFLLAYIPMLYFLHLWRESSKEKIRQEIAHRMPFFADALANALSVGSTLEQAFAQASYYLKGRIKEEFDKLVLKNALGKDIGILLRELDEKFPKTGLTYLISLLEEYKELGVGISPLLKRISIALSEKEEAEEKIRTILAAGSSYAKLAIFVFGGIFLGMSLLLKDQIGVLLKPNLKPVFLFLCLWTCTGVFLVTRITTMDFARNSALKPLIGKFMKEKNWTAENLMYYSAIEWTWWKRTVLFYSPMVFGFFGAYVVSWYTGNPLIILSGLIIGSLLFWMFTKYMLKGIIQDQLIKTIETFPEVLQVFVIGLNSGLNTYLAFQFAQDAVKGITSKLLTEELCRTKFAMECGEAHARTWQRLAEKLPFESVIDFSEIMVVAPLQGESVVKSIVHMTNNYQSKKLTLIEKKATSIGMMVIPFIVVAFFPLFLFALFAPLVINITSLFNH